MRHFVAAFAIVCGVLFIYGFLAPYMRLTQIDDTRDYQIVVTDTAADDRYAVVMVEGCSADVTEDAGVICNNGWYGRSDRVWHRNRDGSVSKQTPVPFRDAPKGAILRFEAVITDRGGKVVNSSSFITRRSGR
jgi:hypothetical protein